MYTVIRRAAVAVALVAMAGCTVHNTEVPALTGPSTFATSLTVSAIPDAINQDGGSQSSVKVLVIGPDGKGISGVPLRLDMVVDGVAQDFGTLSARTIVTNADGVATVIFTAPPTSPNGVFGTCASFPNLPGSCVSIVATPTGTNFQTAISQSVLIRLVPPGQILSSAPTPKFTVTPSSPPANSPALFDASASCGGPLPISGVCPVTRSIAQYSWNFGDGQTAATTASAVSHSFTVQQTYIVTLTVTNDLGAAASTQQFVSVGPGNLPTPLFTVSPAAPRVDETVFFNASTSTAGAGHSIVSYRWSFGDGLSGTGQQPTHKFAKAGSYTVQLTVTDEAGQSNTSSGTNVSVGSSDPTASFTTSVTNPITHTMTFDGSGSSAVSPATIVTYVWAFGDGSPSGAGQTVAHSYVAAGTYTVRLTVTDSLLRIGSTTSIVTVP
jgi:PKD repeat protein